VRVNSLALVRIVQETWVVDPDDSASPFVWEMMPRMFLEYREGYNNLLPNRRGFVAQSDVRVGRLLVR
jgi:hypothetical protein